MTILIVTGIFPPDRGGPASYVPRISAALVQRGHKVEVICLSDDLHQDDSGFPFTVHRVPRKRFWPWRILTTAFAIAWAARRHQLVYVNGLGMEAAIGSALAGRPTVHKIVGDYAWERAVSRGWFRGTLDEYQTSSKGLLLCLVDAVRTFPLRLARKIIVPSKYLSRIAEGWAIPADRIQTIYNAVPPPATDLPSKPSPLPPWPGKTLITVCRLVPWKGVDGLIRLLPKLEGTRLVIAGDGGLRSELASLAQACGVSHRVLFLGDVPSNAVWNYLQQADAFVLNSSYEGLPHAVLEAMGAGVPVIATDAGGTRELVEHDVTGLLIPVGDGDALRLAVERMWSEPGLTLRLSEEASRRIPDRFGFERMVDCTEDVLLAHDQPEAGFSATLEGTP